MKKRGKGSKTDRNQKVAVDLCVRDNCEYLENEDGSKPKCHCPVSMQYINAFKGNWRKRREDDEEEKEEDEQEDSGQTEQD